MLTQRPRGTADILPGEIEQWQAMEQIIRDTCALYHFEEVRTPVFEHTELFARGVGETTDIVSKEMYTFTDRGGRSVTLRPEGTAGVVRAFVENKLYGLPHTVKLYYIGPMFRYEKPQRGRWRQFHQYGVEVLGAEHPAADAEVIAVNLDLLRRFGLRDLTVELNSVGCPVCRPRHREQMLERLRPVADRLCGDCQQRLERNPLRIFDCKNDRCQQVLAEVGAPTILESLCDDCRRHFEQVRAFLDAMDVPYVINDRLVRGLDYYTRTAWEVTVPGFSSVGGGGRYNGLVAELGGPETPGVGFAGSIERALMVLHEQGGALPGASGVDVWVAVADESAEVPAMRLLQQLRSEGIRADRDYLGKGLKAQLKSADRMQAAYCAILGADEVARGTVTVKDLRTGAQTEVPVEEVVHHVRKGGIEDGSTT